MTFALDGAKGTISGGKWTGSFGPDHPKPSPSPAPAPLPKPTASCPVIVEGGYSNDDLARCVTASCRLTHPILNTCSAAVCQNLLKRPHKCVCVWGAWGAQPRVFTLTFCIQSAHCACLTAPSRCGPTSLVVAGQEPCGRLGGLLRRVRRGRGLRALDVERAQRAALLPPARCERDGKQGKRTHQRLHADRSAGASSAGGGARAVRRRGDERHAAGRGLRLGQDLGSFQLQDLERWLRPENPPKTSERGGIPIAEHSALCNLFCSYTVFNDCPCTLHSCPGCPFAGPDLWRAPREREGEGLRSHPLLFSRLGCSPCCRSR